MCLYECLPKVTLGGMPESIKSGYRKKEFLLFIPTIFQSFH